MISTYHTTILKNPDFFFFFFYFGSGLCSLLNTVCCFLRCCRDGEVKCVGILDRVGLVKGGRGCLRGVGWQSTHSRRQRSPARDRIMQDGMRWDGAGLGWVMTNEMILILLFGVTVVIELVFLALARFASFGV